jgi:hypothetical protein
MTPRWFKCRIIIWIFQHPQKKRQEIICHTKVMNLVLSWGKGKLKYRGHVTCAEWLGVFQLSVDYVTEWGPKCAGTRQVQKRNKTEPPCDLVFRVTVDTVTFSVKTHPPPSFSHPPTTFLVSILGISQIFSRSVGWTGWYRCTGKPWLVFPSIFRFSFEWLHSFSSCRREASRTLRNSQLSCWSGIF